MYAREVDIYAPSIWHAGVGGGGQQDIRFKAVYRDVVRFLSNCAICNLTVIGILAMVPSI